MNKEVSKAEYQSRINKVLDYIDSNINKPLSLNLLADIANFSPYYFHRIFGAMVGETLNSFINRIRIERAATQLISNPNKTITEIALDCGFSGSASFARAFKDFYGISASDWRSKKECREQSKIRKVISKDSETYNNIGKENRISSVYFDGAINKQIWRIEMIDKKHINVEVKELPETEVVYVRHIGPYKGNSELFKNLFERLFRWAGSRGLLQFPKTKCMCVYHDNPEITDETKLRTSCCISVDSDVKVEGEIGKMTIPSGRYAMARFDLKPDEYQEAWELVYGGWLPESGFQPDDRPCFEIYNNDPKTHPEGRCIVDICVPVIPL